MSDRELLEDAAKAAGLTVSTRMQAERDAEIDPETAGLWLTNGQTWWSPLADDGDALRLAVALDIEIYQGDDDGPAVFAGYWGKPERRDVTRMFCIESLGDDKFAATRRAIVRAAAAVAPKAPEVAK